MITPGFGGMGLLDSFMFGGGFEILFFLIFALVLCLFIVMIVRVSASGTGTTTPPG